MHEHKCEWCGNPFEMNGAPSRGPSRKRFCSESCRDAAQCQRQMSKIREHHTETCKQCGKQFHPKASNRTTYCSRECAFDARSDGKTCPCCGVSMTSTEFSSKTYCSPACRQTGIATRPSRAMPKQQRHCPDCGKTLERYQHRCGTCRSMRAEIATERAKERARTIGTNNSKPGSKCWITRSRRLSIYMRDGYTCHICGEQTDPTARHDTDWYPSLDHIVPRSHGGTDEDSNLKTAHRWCNIVRSTASVEAIQSKLCVA